MSSRPSASVSRVTREEITGENRGTGMSGHSRKQIVRNQGYLAVHDGNQRPGARLPG